ncbi:uncharacterized protein LOC144715483 [Wolffia australiana]
MANLEDRASSGTTQGVRQMLELVQEYDRSTHIIFPGVPEQLRYDGLNILHWGQYIELILEGMDLSDHLFVSKNPTDPGYKVWKREDALIRAWLLRSMAGEEYKNFLLLKTAKDIWDHAQKGSSKGRDWRIYRLVTRAANLTQGERNVTSYVNELQSIWREIDHYRPVRNPNSEEWAYVLKDRLYKFLMGLNGEYEAVRSQILNREKVPDLEEAIRLIREEEERFSVASEPLAGDSGTGLMSKTVPQKTQPTQTSQKNQKFQPKDGLFCKYCKRRNHNIDQCWKLYGKPARTGQANNVISQEEIKDDFEETSSIDRKTSQAAPGSELSILKEEVERLKTMLGSTSMARSGTQPKDWIC